MNISTSLHSKIRFFLSCDWCLVCASNICTQRISQRNPFLAAEAYHRNPRRYPRRSMFKKGRYFFSWSPPYFVNCLRFGGFVIRPWKIVPFKFLNFLLWVWDQPIFYKVPPPKKKIAGPVQTYWFCVVLIFLWYLHVSVGPELKRTFAISWGRFYGFYEFI
jgi:hypothetical protein